MILALAMTPAPYRINTPFRRPQDSFAGLYFFPKPDRLIMTRSTTNILRSMCVNRAANGIHKLRKHKYVGTIFGRELRGNELPYLQKLVRPIDGKLHADAHQQKAHHARQRIDATLPKQPQNGGSATKAGPELQRKERSNR